MPLRNVQQKTQIKTEDQRSATRTHLSTNIVIYAGNNVPVAAVKELSINEARDITTIAEVGTDGLIDSAPRASATISGSCNRTRFGGKRIAEAFGKGFLHVKSQRTPFDIRVFDFFRGDGDSVVVTTIENVWIKSIDYRYSSDDFVIVDNMSWTAEDIYSTLSGQTGESSLALFDRTNLIINPFEASADVGNYRGALDAAGLLNAFDGGTL